MLLTTLLLASCTSSNHSSTQKNNQVDYLVFGVFCGESPGRGLTMYKVNDTALYIDSTDTYLKLRGAPFTFSFLCTSGPKFTAARELVSKIPHEFYTLDTIGFGCPDCLDQCGVYVEARTSGNIKRWSIDTDTTRIPSYAIAFEREIYRTLGKLR